MNQTCPVEPVIPQEGGPEILATSYALCPAEGKEFLIYLDSQEADDISTAIAGGTYWFPPEFHLLPELVAPGSRVLDLGAHIGTFTLFASALGYQVVSVEASPHNVALLRHSARENGFIAQRIVSAAVSDHVGRLEFVQAGPYGLVSNPNLNDPTVSVPAVTVDKLLDDVGWDGVEYIKMDVEGSEVAALRGMSGLLSREDAPPILYESNAHTLNLFGETPARLMSLLEGYGYRCYLVQGNRLVRAKSNELQLGVCENYLATKQPPQALRSWQVVPPMPFKARAIKILSESVSPNVHARIHVARSLSQADASELADRRVANALAFLATDPDASVRAAAAWWREVEPGRARPIGSRQVGEAHTGAAVLRVPAHLCYRVILERDREAARSNLRENTGVRVVIALLRRVLRAVRARLSQWMRRG